MYLEGRLDRPTWRDIHIQQIQCWHIVGAEVEQRGRNGGEEGKKEIIVDDAARK